MIAWLVLKFWSLNISHWLFQGARRVIPRNTLMFHLAQEGKTLEVKVFWLSAPNLKDIPYKIDSLEPWTGLVLNVLSKGAQNCCQLCPKSELNLAKRWHFISAFQDAKVIVNHWDKPDDSVMCAGEKYT